MISVATPESYHALYLAVRRAHAIDPVIWNSAHCTRVLTSIMGARQFSWRVVGITEKALKLFHQHEYRKPSDTKLTRAHLRPRAQFVKELMAMAELSVPEFVKFWLENDCTVICGPGENTTSVGKYIRIENENGALFGSGVVAWQHGTTERDLLRRLYAEHFPNDAR
jgi:hypothetical protein